MNLYFLTFENDDGENLDLFITADSHHAAVLMFRAEWADQIDEDELTGPIRYGAPHADHVESALRIFVVRPRLHMAGVLSWNSMAPGYHGSVDLVGWVAQND